jgi:uncharacterized membrane protein YdjX (TVP38/TMEM64 family)
MTAMKPSKRTYALLGTILLILIAWALFFYFVPPEVLVDRIGIRNTYLAAFILAVVGGFSSITGTSLYAALAAFAQGGVNTWILGIVGGLGIFFSDSLFYFLASYGREMITKIAARWNTVFDRIRRWIKLAPDWLVYTGVFLYSAFAPIPNDILLAVLALSGYSYRQFAPYLLLGDLTMTIILTNLAERVG